MSLQDPYGTHTNRRQIAPVTHMIYQGEQKNLVFTMPESYTTFDKATLSFVIVDGRFKREILFKADPVHFTEMPTPEDRIKVQVVVPATVTKTFRRGAFLYSMEVRPILGDEREVVEEGSITVEYQAGAPDPDVPYKDPDTIDETQNDG